MRHGIATCLSFVLLLAWTSTAQDTTNQQTQPPAAAPEKLLIHTSCCYRNLSVSVFDHHHHPVTDLKASDFSISTDGKPRDMITFRRDDTPVSVGILVDNSGSMKDRRDAFIHAVSEFVKAGNPQNEMFVVNFNDRPYIDQQMTTDVNLVDKALKLATAHGPTALFDTLFAATDYLARHGKNPRKILLLMSDGEDNSSRYSLAQVISEVQSLQKKNDITIYSTAAFGPKTNQIRARHDLDALAQQTGGVALYAGNPKELEQVCQAVALEIRNHYVMSYKLPGESGKESGQVQVLINNRKDLEVHVH
jgi:Ca-activated chloride channel homolog